MGPFLQANNLSVRYADRVALADVSLSLSAGRITVLLGPNGSGKSTLIKALLGHLPAEGKIVWDSKPMEQWKRRDLARIVAYLPQSPAYEPGQTVLDVLRQGRAPYWGAFGLESSADEKFVNEIAAMLSLTDLLDRPMEAMSGGQRQRVCVGRCLVQQPRALLLDEPNTFLDLAHQMELCKLLRDLAGKQNMAVLMASHDLNLAGAFADRLILLSSGKLTAEGSPDEVLRAEFLSPVYGVEIQRIDIPGKRPIVLPLVG